MTSGCWNGIGIKCLLDAVGIIAAQVCVNTAQLELMLLVEVKTAGTKVNAASESYYCKLIVNGNETIGFDKSNVKGYNFHKRRHFTRECRAPKNQDNKHKESSRRSVHVKTSASIALVSCDGLGGYDWSDQTEEGPNMHPWLSHLYVLTQ
nr:hypothetical protein [Tanacetum cinerariifolium]